MAPKRAASGSSQDCRRKSNKYTDVFFYESVRRWVAWVREPKVGGGLFYLGSHSTEKLAARCQDRALLKLEMDPSMTERIKPNLQREDYQQDEHLRNTLTTEDFIYLLFQENLKKLKQADDEHATADLALVADLTVWHQMPYLSAQRLIQLNCKRWSVWEPDNIKRIAEARRADDTRDWYFPIVFRNYRSEDPALRTPAAARWSTWFGIWHPAADDASEGHRLPP